jgi:hypothetical protein
MVARTEGKARDRYARTRKLSAKLATKTPSEPANPTADTGHPTRPTVGRSSRTFLG